MVMNQTATGNAVQKALEIPARYIRGMLNGVSLHCQAACSYSLTFDSSDVRYRYDVQTRPL